jgi:hypothetical protein
VKRAAAVRLLMAADSVAGELVRIALSKDVSDSTKVQAIFGILDRAGLSPRQQIDMDVEIGGKQSVWDRIVLASTTPVSEWDEEWEGDLNGSRDRVIDAEIVEIIPADPAAERRQQEDDERIAARDRLMEKRRRSGKQRALSPSAERKFARRKPPPVDIEEDPRSRPEQPPSTRAERRAEYEAELLRRDAPRTRRGPNRTQRVMRQDEI